MKLEGHDLTIAAGLALAAVAVAFVVGRVTAPVETRDVERVVFRDRVVEKVVEKAARVETRIVYRDRVITRDGTVTEHEVERTAEAEGATRDTSTVATSTGTAERSTVTLVRPSWRVGVLAGASVREPLLPIAGPLVLGVEVDYRIAGGLSAGVWANTSGAAGAALALEF